MEKMNLQIGNNSFTATLESNAAVDALVDIMREAPVVIQMSDYSGFEKVGSLETSLPTSNKQTTTQSVDIVLYNGNQIVIFYGTNSWSYTRLGRIDDLSGCKERRCYRYFFIKIKTANNRYFTTRKELMK